MRLIKEICPVGKHIAKDKDGKDIIADIPRERALNWANSLARMKGMGYSIPAPLEHDFQALPSKNPTFKETFENLWVNDQNMIVGEFEVPEDKFKEYEERGIKGCSLYADNFEGLEDVICHVCFTPNPIAQNTKGFEPKGNPTTIAMSSSLKNPNRLSELAQRLKSIGVVVDACDNVDKFLDRLLTAINQLAAQNSDNPDGLPAGANPVPRRFDVAMSNNQPTKPEVEQENTRLKDSNEKLKKQIEELTNKNTRLLEVFSKQERTRLTERVDKLKDHVGEDTHKTLTKQVEEFTVELDEKGEVVLGSLHAVLSAHEMHMSDDKKATPASSQKGDAPKGAKRVERYSGEEEDPDAVSPERVDEVSKYLQSIL